MSTGTPLVPTQATIGNLFPPPDSFHFSAPREQDRTTAIAGITLRFASLRPQKIIKSLAPPQGYRLEEKIYPRHPWSAPPHTYSTTFSSPLNVDYLAINVPRIIRAKLQDEQYATYMYNFYTRGADDHSRLPVSATRLAAPNQVIPGTPRGSYIDQQIDTAIQHGVHFATPLPIPGTVVVPVNVNTKVRYHDLKIKNRPTMDPNWPRATHSAPGPWCHGEDRLYSTESIWHTLVSIAKNNVVMFTALDYERAFNWIPIRPDNIPRNCFYWRHNKDTQYKYHYFTTCNFGGVATPNIFHRHAYPIQLLQEEAISAATGTIIPMARQTDDTLLMFPKGQTQHEPAAFKAFVNICETAKIPLSLDKTIRAVSSIRFNGFRLEANLFPNSHGVSECGVGMDLQRCFKIRRAIRQALAGTSVKQIASLHGLLTWAATVLPHTRVLINCIMKDIMGKPDHIIHTLSLSAKANLQRLHNIYKKATMVPLYNLLVLIPPSIHLYTDASGSIHQGRQPHWGGYDDSKEQPWFFSHPIPETLWTTHPNNTTPETTYTSTALLELLALYIILHTGNKLYKKSDGTSITWHTDSDACVSIWRNQKSTVPALNTVLIWIATYCSTHNILIDAVHIPRKYNQAADALTHDDTVLFQQLTSIPLRCRRSPDSRKINSCLYQLSYSAGRHSASPASQRTTQTD